MGVGRGAVGMRNGQPRGRRALQDGTGCPLSGRGGLPSDTDGQGEVLGQASQAPASGGPAPVPGQGLGGTDEGVFILGGWG